MILRKSLDSQASGSTARGTLPPELVRKWLHSLLACESPQGPVGFSWLPRGAGEVLGRAQQEWGYLAWNMCWGLGGG